MERIVLAAVKKVCGEDCFGDTRHLRFVDARRIAAKEMFVRGYRHPAIAEVLLQKCATIYSLLRTYDELFACDPNFKSLAERVRKLLPPIPNQ